MNFFWSHSAARYIYLLISDVMQWTLFVYNSQRSKHFPVGQSQHAWIPHWAWRILSPTGVFLLCSSLSGPDTWKLQCLSELPRVYKQVMANLMLGRVTLRWTSIPHRGSKNAPSLLMRRKPLVWWAKRLKNPMTVILFRGNESRLLDSESNAVILFRPILEKVRHFEVLCHVDFLSNKASFPLKISTSFHNYSGDKFILLENKACAAAYCTAWPREIENTRTSRSW